jgi:hypothetical protein
LIEIISHRGFWLKKDYQNTIQSFENSFRKNYGVELDVRDSDSKIIVSHDVPTNKKDLFELSDVFELYNKFKKDQLTFAINIKADGLASELKYLLNHYRIDNYFTFDMSIPEMLCYKNAGLKYLSRLSEYEPNPVMLDDAVGIWLDAFESEWYDQYYISNLINIAERICIVSAELHAREYKNQWVLIKKLNDQNKLIICTDKPDDAKEFFG